MSDRYGEEQELEETESSTHQSLLHPQLNWMKRKFPKNPGFFSVSVDIVITNIMQLILVFTNILVMFSSATIDYDKDTLGWIIFAMFVFTWIGFGVYIRKIRHHAIIYRTFFKRIDKCYYNENERLSNNNNSSCFCLRCICIQLFWWLYALFIFPFIILWAVWKSYKHYKNERKISRSDVTTDITQINWDSNNNLDINNQDEYIKIAETAYNVSHFGVLSKQASMMVCFIQDIPLLILSAIIGNIFGLIVYIIIIILKFIFWVKYMIDVARFTIFYDYEDYLLSFGLKRVKWEIDTFGCSYVIPIFLTDIEKQRVLWQIKDYVKCLKDKESKQWVVMIILAINRKKDQIIVADASFGDTDFVSVEELNKMIDDKGSYTFNRWDEGIQPLNNEELIEFLENRDDNDNIDDGHDVQTSTKTQTSRPVEIVEINKEENKNDNKTIADNKESEEEFEVIVNQINDEENYQERNNNEINKNDKSAVIVEQQKDDNNDENGNEYQSVSVNGDKNEQNEESNNM